jgi:hypothetical protein
MRSGSSQLSTCEELASLAEHELFSFVRAVTELFGSGQARRSANEWLKQLERMHALTPHLLRQVSVLATAQIANDLTAETRGPSIRRFRDDTNTLPDIFA